MGKSVREEKVGKLKYKLETKGLFNAGHGSRESLSAYTQGGEGETALGWS